MFGRINCFKIVRNHFKTFRILGQESDRIYWQDFILFILIPFAISAALSYYDFQFKNQITNLIAAISILGGFLFNLLAIIYNSMENLKKDINETNIDKPDLKRTYAKEIHSNISYNILLAIICIILLLLYNIDIPDFSYCSLVERLILFFNCYFLISFFLTLLMVLNRVYILLDKNIN